MGLKLVERKARKIYEKMSGSHDWNHITRVKKNALKILKIENGDIDIVMPACILHDLGRIGGKEKNHSQVTEVAERILVETGYNKEKSGKIIDCVRNHSFGSRPTSLEAKILFDADKMDSYGYLGIARFFSLAGEKKWAIKQAVENASERIKALKSISGFYTKGGKILGIKKAKKTLKFYQELAKEMGMEINF